jgi:hypothetical protein
MKSVGVFVCLLSAVLPTLARPVADPVVGAAKRDLYLRDDDTIPSMDGGLDGGPAAWHDDDPSIDGRAAIDLPIRDIGFCQGDEESCNPNPPGTGSRSPDGIGFCQGDDSCNPNPPGIGSRSPDGIGFCQGDDSCNPIPGGIRRSPDGGLGDNNNSPSSGNQEGGPDDNLETDNSSPSGDGPQKRGGRLGDITKRGGRFGDVTKRDNRDGAVTKRDSRYDSVTKRGQRGGVIAKRGQRGSNITKKDNGFEDNGQSAGSDEGTGEVGSLGSD